MTDEKGNVVTGDATKTTKINLTNTDNTTYAKSAATGNVVSNQLQEIDFNYYKENAITYLTRSDWTTFPKSYTGLEATDKLKTDLDGHTYTQDPSITADSVTTDAENDIMFADLKDVSYDDEETWDKFLDQLSLDDLATIIGETMGNKAITTVNKPANNNTDGPKGLGSSYRYGDGTGITLYVDEVVMASTFNTDLLSQRGSLFAEDALYAGYSMIFAPGADWHRTAYAGRNSEYYSEDGNMSFLCGAAQVKTMQAGGLIAGIKHFVGNDQETNRHGVATFATEQGFREGSLRCFEGALRDDVGGALGVMTCFNRVGATAGAGSYATQIAILRNEWGFKGVTITDSSKDASEYVHTEECLINGTDMFNNDASRTDALIEIVDRNQDGTILSAMRTANKHYYYAFAHSNLINGLTHDTVVSDFVPWWKTALNVGQYVSIALIVVCGALFVVTALIERKNGDEMQVKKEKEAKHYV
jgi:beta-glucosidase